MVKVFLVTVLWKSFVSIYTLLEEVTERNFSRLLIKTTLLALHGVTEGNSFV